jgi:hypothetical protein
LKKKALEKLHGKKTAAIMTLSLLILVVCLFSMKIPEVKATIGTHLIEAEYYRAYIHDSHDNIGPIHLDGEWYFRLTAGGSSVTTTQRSVGDGEYEDFSLHREWYTTGGSTSFQCRAWEQDGTDVDYSSTTTVSIPIPGTAPNGWVSGSATVGDVRHYYRYGVHNNLPVLSASTIGGPASGYRGISYTFTASATDSEGDSVTFEWKVDNVARSSTGESMSKTFASNTPLGAHTISVRAKDALGGFSDWKDKTFTLINKAPELGAISGPSTVYRGDTVTFHVAGTDAEGDYPLSYTWQIDGYDMGVNSPTLSFVHTSDPSSVGDHVVRVRAADSKGAVGDWVTKDFETLNHAPTVSAISGPTSGYRGTYTWTATGSDAEGDALTYYWYVDGTYKSGGSSFSYTFGSSDTIGSHTIKVRVKDAIGDYSDYSTLAFTLNALPKVATPTFSPAGGTYSSNQSVTISCSTSDATIYYTVDESEPTSSSTVYSGPIAVNSGTVTIKAKAFKSGMTESDTASATYTIQTAADILTTPTFSLASGSYASGQSVTITCSTSEATIRYTLDGSEPTSSSTVYSGPIAVNSGTVTIKAKAFKSGMTESATVSATYTIGESGSVWSLIEPIWIGVIAVLAIAIATATILLWRRKK